MKCVEWYQGFYAKPSICCQVIFPLINYGPVQIIICHFPAEREGWTWIVVILYCRPPLRPLPNEVFVTLVTNYNATKDYEGDAPSNAFPLHRGSNYVRALCG